MNKIRLYLDNCCFNRPYDDQNSLRVRLETEVKLDIQNRIREGEFELAWSYILTFENAQNPHEERRAEIRLWRSLAQIVVSETPQILEKMRDLESKGIKSLDALHISCAIAGKCAYFITVDKGILNKQGHIQGITVINPIDFLELPEVAK
jgi:predicted nucleic acid-binding protein